MHNDDLIPIFIPSLCSILLHKEDEKGAPLCIDEVISIRDQASVIMVPSKDLESYDQKRGYKDIDPENVWYDWQMLRDAMGRKPKMDPGIKTYKIDKNNDEITKTIIEAKETLGYFCTLFLEFNKSTAQPLIKTVLSDTNQEFNLWLFVESINTTTITGVIFELPITSNKYHVNDKIVVNKDEIIDWMINDNGNLYGGYSLRLHRKKLNINEQIDFDKHIGVNNYL